MVCCSYGDKRFFNCTRLLHALHRNIKWLDSSSLEHQNTGRNFHGNDQFKAMYWDRTSTCSTTNGPCVQWIFIMIFTTNHTVLITPSPHWTRHRGCQLRGQISHLLLHRPAEVAIGGKVWGLGLSHIFLLAVSCLSCCVCIGVVQVTPQLLKNLFFRVPTRQRMSQKVPKSPSTCQTSRSVSSLLNLQSGSWTHSNRDRSVQSLFLVKKIQKKTSWRKHFFRLRKKCLRRLHAVLFTIGVSHTRRCFQVSEEFITQCYELLMVHVCLFRRATKNLVCVIHFWPPLPGLD